ncbi:MAG TPA: hypothetical protein DIW23_05915 [Anaerolineae bacterium]|nr:hypothetical protein [Anaerolineae bacterium]
MGYLMRRNIMTYKAPPNNAGYDLICIHPDPRHKSSNKEKERVLIQVKSRYQTDSNMSFPIKESSLNAFDFLVVTFLNIGNFYGKNVGLDGMAEPVFYTLPNEFIKLHHNKSTSWQKVSLKKVKNEIEIYKNENGFEQIVQALGISKPIKIKKT